MLTIQTIFKTIFSLTNKNMRAYVLSIIVIINIYVRVCVELFQSQQMFMSHMSVNFIHFIKITKKFFISKVVEFHLRGWSGQ